MLVFLAILSSASASPNDNDVYENNIPGVDVVAECNKRYFPPFEVRYLSDVPVKIIVGKRSGEKTQVGPAAGLDVFALWYTPVHPACMLLGPERASIPRNGISLHAMLGLNASLAALSKTSELKVVTDTQTMTAEDRTISEANIGGLFSVNIGTYIDMKFDAGGHENHLAFAAIAGFGYYAGSANGGSGATYSLALGVVISK